jgi:transcriptional regulator with GAF, ATPase, and Fis domain
MHDMATLITGPSGTGKELVASAIGLARYIPFDAAKERFAEAFQDTFHPLNLSALAQNLVESELFGHKRGAFTGAVSDRPGYLDAKGSAHTVFLDEIGDVAPSIQLKLLRVLQTREFQALGDSDLHRFDGKIIAATNRDLPRAVEEGGFRRDLYYRLCSDHIETPSLEAQIADAPDELTHLVALIASRIVGEAECEAVTCEVSQWIQKNLGRDYPWPGNIRELEQCIRNIVVHGAYHPLGAPRERRPMERLTRAFATGSLSADEMLSKYCTLVYAQTGRYQEAARRLGLDRRTVKSRVDTALLRELK